MITLFYTVVYIQNVYKITVLYVYNSKIFSKIILRCVGYTYKAITWLQYVMYLKYLRLWSLSVRWLFISTRLGGALEIECWPPSK